MTGVIFLFLAILISVQGASICEEAIEKPYNENRIKSTTHILRQLRELMIDTRYVDKPLQAYIIPGVDEHQSEYVSDYHKRKDFVSGFTGSSGTIIVTATEALLWTDGRYYLQASLEMDNNWTLMKSGLLDTPSQSEWINENLPEGSRIGVDPFLVTLTSWKSLQANLDNDNQILVAVKTNLVDVIWEDRPAAPSGPIVPLPVKYTGKTSGSKIAEVRSKMQDKNCGILVLSALDEVAYLLNLRGSDIDYNPVFFSYVILTKDKILLFVNESKITQETRDHFASEGITVDIYPYAQIIDKLKEMVSAKTEKVWVSASASFALNDVVPEKRRFGEITHVENMKAVKNSVEANGMIQSHIRDAAAVVTYFSWLEKEVPKGTVTEISGATKLQEFRSVQKDFVGLSFETISSSGPNAAMAHYSPSPESDRTLTTQEIYLCDSGAQYKDGTTDVTRTLHFGTPTSNEKEKFTLVLKGQIAVRSAIFPYKLKGNALDTLARQYLWNMGLDYEHGTGHGIGMYLNVHEGPMGISTSKLPNDQGLEANMFLSNEPGYYEDGKFGIRIEDIVQVVPATGVADFKGRGALTFNTITMVPIQIKLIDVSMLRDKEIAVINDFHKSCLELVGPLLKEQGQLEAFDYLVRETAAITRA